MKKAYIINIIVLLVTLMFVFVGTIVYQEKMLSRQNAILNEYLSFDKSQTDISEITKRLETLLSGQIEIKELWWNTLLGQGALSIVITLIVVIISITVGIINKSEIDERIRTKVEYLETQNKSTIMDFILVNESHRGSYGAILTSTEMQITHYIDCLNSFEKLMILKRSDFQGYYEGDVSWLSNMLCEQWFDKKDIGIVEKDLTTLINKYDRYIALKKIPQSAYKYVEDHGQTAELMKSIDKLIDYCSKKSEDSLFCKSSG